MNEKPWDARLAAVLVQPLRDTRVSPNHLTTLRLGAGLVSAWAFADGHWPNLAAGLLVLSNLLDHTDGELARMSGKTSRIGHLYDLASDALVHVLLFLCIGVGLSRGGAGDWPLVAGAVSAVAVAAIFHMRNEMEKRHGKAATAQIRYSGFEAEDILYLLPVVTMTGGLRVFLAAAAVGAPLAAVLVGRHYLQGRTPHGAASTGD
ncbi:MAG: CDP-alcohol phosphatidyltransferase family protein [Gammaproteobacteria bacterium]